MYDGGAYAYDDRRNLRITRICVEPIVLSRRTRRLRPRHRLLPGRDTMTLTTSRFLLRRPSRLCGARCSRMTGWSMPSLHSEIPFACCAISAATPTASPSAIGACSASMVTTYASDGKTITWQQAAHHDAHRKRVPAPLLPACAAQGLRSHPPLRLSRQRTPGCSHRARSPAARLSTSD